MRGLAASVVLAACYAPDPPSGAPCATGQVCPSGLSCIAGVCLDRAAPPVDSLPPGVRDAPPGPDGALACPPAYTRTPTGACHRTVMIPDSWTEAERRCELDGGHLAVIDSLAEAVLIPEPAWIGLSDRAVEGTFRWITDEPLTFAHWSFGEPSSSTFANCAHTAGVGQGFWSAGPCEFSFGYVCEYDGRPAVAQ